MLNTKNESLKNPNRIGPKLFFASDSEKTRYFVILMSEMLCYLKFTYSNNDKQKMFANRKFVINVDKCKKKNITLHSCC